MQPGSAPPAGWFPDPAGSGRERWWSGQAWTEHVRQAAAVAVAEPPAPATPVANEGTHPSFPPIPSDAAPGAAGSAIPAALLEAIARADAAPQGPAAAAAPVAPVSAPVAPAMPAAAAAPAAAIPASATVGFTAHADPTVADRYRAATAASAATDAAPAWATTPAHPIPHPSAPHYAMSDYSASSGHLTGEKNKIAVSALTTGAIALGFTIVAVFFDRIALGVVISGTAAIVQGIIGIVRARRSGNGLGFAIGGLAAGASALVVLAVVVGVTVLAALTPRFDVPALEDEIVYAGQDYGVVSASCPADPPVATGTEFVCVAKDADGAAFAVRIVNDDDFYYTIYFDDAGF